ncbi:MAG: MFS transporter [Actinomycetota bacterium]|nr:MFS transporter [Actinomycetota bacterium]
MSAVVAGSPPGVARRLRTAFIGRTLERYPSDRARLGYLGIVTLTTITLYYLYYVEGAVTPLLLPSYHMSFLYFLYLLVISNAIGAFTAFIGGLSDRIGRANLAIVGTAVIGAVQLSVPSIHSRLGFAVAYCAIGFVEGVILVATPALMRDFSPQLGRASAMGFWALGPVVGSLAASLVANHTLPHLHAWQDQFVISGLVCMAVVVIAFLGLRELAPGLRDQLMVSQKERMLLEARAAGIDVDAATRHPLRTMLKKDLVASSVGISLFLLIYYASVSVLTIFWAVVFNRTTSEANGINTWYWVADAVTLVVVGLLSDAFKVRKPFMLAGAIGGIVMTLVLIHQTGQAHVGYYGNVVVVVLLGVMIGIAYTPWMAGYTEAVEAHNPALSATGLAVWGWILRIVVAASFLVLPHVITTATTLVDNSAAASELQAFQAAQPYVPSLAPHAPAAPPVPSSVVAQLKATNEPGPQALSLILEKYKTTHNVLAAAAGLPKALAPELPQLLAFQPLATAIQQGRTVTDAEIAKVGPAASNLVQLLKAARVVIPAQRHSAKQWQHWWWVCLGGEVAFLLLIFATRGRWSPRRARRDIEEREARVAEAMAELRPAGDRHAG